MKKRLPPTPMIIPMPALLVGTSNEDGSPNAMTAAWAASCCAKPVCVGVAVRNSRKTFTNMKRTGSFTLNVPSASQATQVDYLGIVSGNDGVDKMKRAEMQTAKSNLVEAPLLVSCPINLECKITHELNLGSHFWIVGEVLAVHVDEHLLNDEGQLDVKACDPLVYETSDHNYHSLGPVVARAFNVGNKLKTDQST